MVIVRLRKGDPNHELIIENFATGEEAMRTLKLFTQCKVKKDFIPLPM